MRSIAILTNKRITQEDGLRLLKGKIAGIRQNGADELCATRFPKSVFLFFETGDPEKDEPIPEEWLDKLPSKGFHCVDVEYHLSSVTKRIVEALMGEYPDMYVVVDEIFEDGDIRIVKAEEYLKMEFDW